MPFADAEPLPPGEAERLREILGVLARHGWRGIAARLGLDGDAGDDGATRRPEALVAALRDLGPVAVKLGQILATRSDLLEPEMIAALATLQDRMPPLPYPLVAPVIEQALGAAPEALFAAFDPEPLAAASIAQVHAAALADGRRVVVKVRRPGTARTVETDIRLVRRLARLAAARSPEVRRLRPDELLRQFSDSLARELDLGAEARSAEEIGAFLAAMGVHTPAIAWELTGRLVNVQERIDGWPATDPQAAAAAGVDLGAAARLYARAVLRMILVNGHFHADPHPGNVFFLSEGRLAFIDFGAVGQLGAARRDELVRLLLAIAADDIAAVAGILLGWAGDEGQDRAALEQAIAALIAEFSGLPLAEIELARIFDRIFAMLRRFRLVLPSDLALMLRTLLTAEGFVRRLDPAFDIASQFRPILSELAADRADPRRLMAAARRLLVAAARASGAAPALIAHAERVARSGRIPVTTDPRSFAGMEGTIDRAGRSLSRAILGGALLIAAAVLAPFAPAAGIAAAAAGVVLGLVALRRSG
jgi:ubiquinone biosynthesis protein